jgi:hypothetical protein
LTSFFVSFAAATAAILRRPKKIPWGIARALVQGIGRVTGQGVVAIFGRPAARWFHCTPKGLGSSWVARKLTMPTATAVPRLTIQLAAAAEPSRYRHLVYGLRVPPSKLPNNPVLTLQTTIQAGALESGQIPCRSGVVCSRPAPRIPSGDSVVYLAERVVPVPPQRACFS